MRGGGEGGGGDPLHVGNEQRKPSPKRVNQ